MGPYQGRCQKCRAVAGQANQGEEANVNFEKLWKLIDSMSEEALNTKFDFSDDLKKKEAHWRRDKNLRDVLIHLYERHQLLLKWIKSNVNGNNADVLPRPYTWKIYGEMNITFLKLHQNTKLENAKNMIKESHKNALSFNRYFFKRRTFYQTIL